MSDHYWEHQALVEARTWYAYSAIALVQLGIHLFMTLYSLSVFMETPEHLKKGRGRYIAASFVITALLTFSTSLGVANNFQALLEATSSRHWVELAVASGHAWKSLLNSTTGAILIGLGDALLVYRCYVFCTGYQWVAILPGATCLGAMVLLILATYIEPEDSGFNVSLYSSLSMLLTVLTNVVVTALITLRLLRVRRTMSKVLPESHLQLYTGVVAILIESALPLTVSGIIAGALVLARSTVSSLRQSEGALVCTFVFYGLFYSFCALSPQMIIFRVTTGRSLQKFPEVKDGALSSPIEFAHEAAESNFLQTSRDRELGNGGMDPEDGRGNSRDSPTSGSICRMNDGA